MISIHVRSFTTIQSRGVRLDLDYLYVNGYLPNLLYL